jgi:hypothetical protein
MPFWRIHSLAIVACNDEKETFHMTVPNLQTDLLQLFSHPWASIAAQAETRLFLDVCQRD